MNANLDQLMAAANQAYAQGRFADCQRLCRQVLTQAPTSVAPLVLLGISLSKLNDATGATEQFERAIQADPKCAPAYLWLSMALRSLGQGEAALQRAREATSQNPNDGFAQHNLAQCLLDLGKFAEAEPILRRVTAAAPNVAMAHHSLGVALNGLARKAEAVSAFRRAAQLDPGAVQTQIALRQILIEEGDTEGAGAAARAAVRLNPNSAEAHLWLSRILMEDAKGAEAEAELQTAMRLEPDGAIAHFLLGSALQVKGDIDEAETQFRESIKLNPRQSSAYFALTTNRKMSDGDRPLLAVMDEVSQDEALGAPDRSRLHYAMGQAFEDLGEYENAMRHLDEANRMAYRVKYGSQAFDRRSYAESTDRTIRTFDAKLFEQPSSESSESDLPVFVVGMIRSGTTLVEQILSSHPQIGAAGEQKFWLANSTGALQGNGRVDLSALRRLAGRYEKLLREIAPGKEHVVDKMPMNYMVLGLIHLAFPKARIIHVRRHPVDTCISIYATPNRTKIGWAHDKGNIAFAYREYRRLMEHWRQVLPSGTMIDVEYEQLVGSPETATRALIEFCGVEWNDACLRPQDNKRLVVTPSVWQVRQPVYKTSIARWKRFKPWLGPFEDLKES
ncbi:MAG TPA: sulfotransferase [Fimbriimonas sp.]|nr:sulfotransferase [Fimbriimonas sp.]